MFHRRDTTHNGYFFHVTQNPFNVLQDVTWWATWRKHSKDSYVLKYLIIEDNLQEIAFIRDFKHKYLNLTNDLKLCCNIAISIFIWDLRVFSCESSLNLFYTAVVTSVIIRGLLYCNTPSGHRHKLLEESWIFLYYCKCNILAQRYVEICFFENDNYAFIVI